MKLRMSGFWRRALEAHVTLFGMWIAGYWPVSDFVLVLKAWLGVFAVFLDSGSCEILPVSSLHRASTDALIYLPYYYNSDL